MRLAQTLSSREGKGISKKAVRKLARRSVLTEPTVWLGRNGVTEEFLAQVDAQLDRSELIKVKIHKPMLDSGEANAKELAEQVAKDTSSTVIDVRGRTFTIYRKRARQSRQ